MTNGIFSPKKKKKIQKFRLYFERKDDTSRALLLIFVFYFF